MTDKHPIQVVARRTGLSPHVIRAWERRYNAVQPRRTTTNRRLFTNADIERLTYLRRAIQAGHRIGDIASLPDERLVELVRSAESTFPPVAPPRLESGTPEDARALLRDAIEAVEALDADALDDVFTRATVRLSRPAFMEELVLPLMQTVGEGWRQGQMRIAHEHLATASVRSFLGNLERTYPSETSAPSILVATPAGQIHELGALAAAATAASEGFRVLYLGASLPAEDILAACDVRKARVIALSITYPADDPLLHGELRRLGRGLSPGVTLLVGGQSVAGYRETLEDIGALLPENLGAIRRMLEAVRRTPGRPT